MTGGGGSRVGFAKEQSFMTLPDSPEYYLPGRNLQIGEANLQRQLSRLRTPNNAEAVDSLAGNLEGALSATWAMSADTHSAVRDIVFNDGGSGFTSGLAASSRWYLGAEFVDGTSTDIAERELKGCIPLNYSITYDVGTNTIRESVTMGYADEAYNTSYTPGAIIGPADGSEVPFHGIDVTLDGVSATTALQSLTLSIDGPISRFQRGPDPVAENAILGVPQKTLEMTPRFTGPSTSLERAYGTASATSTQDTLDNVSASVTFDAAGSTVATFDLPKLKPDDYDWSDLVAADTDLTEPTTFHVNGDIAIS